MLRSQDQTTHQEVGIDINTQVLECHPAALRCLQQPLLRVPDAFNCPTLQTPSAARRDIPDAAPSLLRTFPDPQSISIPNQAVGLAPYGRMPRETLLRALCCPRTLRFPSGL